MKNFLFFIVGFGFASILWAAMQPSERAERDAAEQTAWYQGQHYGDSTTETQILNYLDEQKAAWNGVGE